MDSKYAIASYSVDKSTLASQALNASAKLWLLVAIIGQWAFVYYILGFYSGPTFQGNFAAWDNNTLLMHGHIAGDTMGNLLFAAHVMLAAIITFGGTLQLIPYIRKRALTFHRWNGRLYILTALAISIGGLYLVWVRGSTSSFGGAVGISLNAGLIMLFALLAWRHARAGNIITHRRWALRTFIVVSGVWFFRVGMMLWIFLNGGPVGLGENFDGPFIIFWSFGSYLLPLAVLELYLLAQKHDNPMGRFAMAATLFVITIGMGLGIFMAAMGLWLPNL